MCFNLYNKESYITENQGESLAVHGGDESDSADTTHVWYAERMF
jgi:hypothetical protein